MHTLSLVLLSIGGIGDWGMILLAVILLFGGKKIPELMRGLGQGINEFNRAKNNLNTEIQEGVNSASQNVNRPQPTQNQFNSTPSSTTSSTTAPTNNGATD